jgi:hypothetical protein
MAGLYWLYSDGILNEEFLKNSSQRSQIKDFQIWLPRSFDTLPSPDFDRYEKGSSVGLLDLYRPNLQILNKP